MGSRGAGSGRKGSGGNLSVLTKGMFIEGNAGQAEKQTTELLQTANEVFDDFGMEGFTALRFSDNYKADAGVNGLGQLTINPSKISEPSKSNDYFTNDTPAGTGAHEAGHMVVNHLIRNVVAPNATNLEKANARHDLTLEKAIIKEAKTRFGSNPPISGYGSKNVGEKVAEAFCDVYANKGKAKPYSKVIVDVCKDINSGKWTPKIRLNNRV